jgi:PAS domain S-box-containing protein
MPNRNNIRKRDSEFRSHTARKPGVANHNGGRPTEIDCTLSDDRVQTVLNTVGIGVLIFDRDGYLIEANDAFLQMTGYTHEEIVSRRLSWRDMTAPEYVGVSEQQMEKLARTGRIGPYEKEYIGKDGSRRWMLFTGAKLADDTIVEYAIDVSERKKVEEELRTSKAAAEDANRIKDAFLATLSHELRTPLGAILLWTKILEGSHVDAAVLREGIQAIKLSAEAQKELIEDLLDMSRITTGNLRLKPRDIDLLAVVQDALETIRPAAAARQVRLQIDLDGRAGWVHADPDRIRQVMWNLLTNAVKFTPRGGKVDVSLKRQGGEIEIRIKDTGQGISAGFLPFVFQAFRQADTSQARTTGGIGLGLAIAKQLVELHGGSIWAESEGLNAGATFTTRLPMPRLKKSSMSDFAAKAVLARKNAQVAELEGVRLLFVEDDRETRTAVATLLKRAGIVVTEVDSAAEAIRAYEQSEFDLILSDIGMPVEDGYSLIRRIRSMEALRGSRPTPAIALTAFARETDRQMAIGAGYAKHLGKPMDFEEMLSAIRDVSRV